MASQFEIPTNVDVIWRAQEGSQELFLTCPIFEVLYEGTRGGGKTDCLLNDFAQHVGQGFKSEWRGILFRRTYKELGDVVAKSQKLFPRIFPGCTFNKQEFTWTFPDGEQLLLRHAKTVDDYWNYHGHAYPWIGWEELTNWADDGIYRKMMSCCRGTNSAMPRKVRATCNPYGAGHNWVKRRFRLPQGRGIVIRDAVDHDGHPEPPRVALHSSIHENRILLEADPDYISRLRASARNKAELAAWLEGRWDIVAGGMFDDVWDARTHVVQPFNIPATWRVDRSFDWGSSKPFSVGWWAESDGTEAILPDGRRLRTIRGDLFRIYEWYGCSHRESNTGLNMLATEIAKGIREREAAMLARGLIRLKPRPGPADSAIWTEENGPSIASDFSKGGVLWEKADKAPGSRKHGWEQMRKRFLASIPPWERMNAVPGVVRPHNWVREDPGLFSFSTCVAFNDQIPVLTRDDDDPDDVDTDAEDHVADEARYRVRASKMAVRQTGF